MKLGECVWVGKRVIGVHMEMIALRLVGEGYEMCTVKGRKWRDLTEKNF